MPYVKLDCGVLDSTLWVDREARELFLTALLMAVPWEIDGPTPALSVRSLDETGFIVPPGWYGFVNAAGVGIGKRAGVNDRDAVLAALERLGAPEIESRSTAFDGRRLVRIDGGYLVLNYMKYRDRDDAAALRMRRYRERKKKRGAGGEPSAGDAAAEATGLFDVPDVPDVPDSAGDGVTRDGVTVTRNETEESDESRVTVTQAVSSRSSKQEAVSRTTSTNNKSKSDRRATAVELRDRVHRVAPLPAMAKPTGAALIERLGVVMAEVATGTRARLSAEQTRKLQAGVVFAYWMTKFGHGRALLDDKRERVLMKRLEENEGDVSELLHALDGASFDEWVQGTARNAAHKNDGIDYILRDRGHVEQFAQTRAKYRKGELHPLAAKYAAVIDDERRVQAERAAAYADAAQLNGGARNDGQQEQQQQQTSGGAETDSRA